MNKWQKRADEKKEDLKQLNVWRETIEWHKLPDGVRRIICRGEVSFEDSISRSEEWAKQEQN